MSGGIPSDWHNVKGRWGIALVPTACICCNVPINKRERCLKIVADAPGGKQTAAICVACQEQEGELV